MQQHFIGGQWVAALRNTGTSDVSVSVAAVTDSGQRLGVDSTIPAAGFGEAVHAIHRMFDQGGRVKAGLRLDSGSTADCGAAVDPAGTVQSVLRSDKLTVM